MQNLIGPRRLKEKEKKTASSEQSGGGASSTSELRQASRREYLKRRVHKYINETVASGAASTDERSAAVAEIAFRREQLESGKRHGYFVPTTGGTLDEGQLPDVLVGDAHVDDDGDEGDKLSWERQTPAGATTPELPIAAYRDELLALVAAQRVVVVQGETGSGKTTQIPQYLLQAGYAKAGQRIGCTQPRRVAAVSVARRVADELGVTLGREVGYTIRFEDETRPDTQIKYMTDGILLREFLTEPDLRSYSAIMIDEAHERSVQTDLVLGLLRDLLRYRSDLRVIIASATFDTQRFVTFFDNCPCLKIPGRLFDIEVFYTEEPQTDYVRATVETVAKIHAEQPPGDVLVFLTGQEEIDSTAELLAQRVDSQLPGVQQQFQRRELLVCRIYAALPTDMQSRIFDRTPAGARKVVLATNIAETSITIDNIVYVVDPGFHKCVEYNPRTGMQSLVVTPISKASAMQRAGRAGRVAPGKCFRLYTQWAFEHELDADPVPEIQRCNLTSVVLLLKSLGVDDLARFDFIDRPLPSSLKRAIGDLYALGALNETGALTRLGRQMAEIPLDAPMARTLLASHALGVVQEIITIMSMLSLSNSIFYRPRDQGAQSDAARHRFHCPDGDHFSLLNVYNQWRDAGYSPQFCRDSFVQYRSMQKARDIANQLAALVARLNMPLSSNHADVAAVKKAIATGFFANAAAMSRDGTFQTLAYPQQVLIHPSSCLHSQPPKLLIFHELVMTSEKYMRHVFKIDKELLVAVAPHYYQ